MTMLYDVTSNVDTLYDVTLNCLKENGKSFNDVQWIGCKDFSIDINDFIKYSKNINSRTKDVLSVIPRDLVIVGGDFWLERIEFFEDLLMDTIYDCWKYKEKPKKPKENRTIYSLNINDSVYLYERDENDEYFFGITKGDKLEVYLLTSAEDLYEYLAEESEGFCLIAKKCPHTN